MNAETAIDDTSAPWPLTIGTAREELDGFLETASHRETWDIPTRCEPWTVRDVTRHLAATFQRFAEMLEQSRTGDLSRPFMPAQLDDENQRAVDEFEGVPEQRLRGEFERFVGLVDDGRELMAHQRGPIPVALQLLFGLTDIVVHHDDIAAAVGSSYKPRTPVVELVVPVMEHLIGARIPGDPWVLLTDR